MFLFFFDCAFDLRLFDVKEHVMGATRLTDETFEKNVLESELPSLVDFWGSWCPPCKMVEPVMDELAEELEGRINIYKVNIDQNQSVRSEYNIMGAPTFILFDKGRELTRAVGARSKKQLLRMLEQGLGENSSE